MTPSAAETMLRYWGQWHRGSSSLDYPRLNIIGRIMEEGTGASHATVSTGIHMPETVEIVEYCVLTMPKHLQRISKHKYIGQETDKMISDKLRIPEGLCAERINQVVHYLIDHLAENPLYKKQLLR